MRAARGALGRGGRHLHELPAARAADPARRSPRPATRGRAGSWRAALLQRLGRAARPRPRRARSSRWSRSRPRLRRPRLPGARRRRAGRSRRTAGRPRRPAPEGATRVVTVDRNPHPGVGPILSGMAITLKNMREDAVPAPGLHHPVPRAEAEHLGPLPRRPHPHRARGRHAQVRGLLHVRHRVPGRVHLHRVRRAARERRSRSTRRGSRSTSCAASTAASASTPARRRRSS